MTTSTTIAFDPKRTGETIYYTIDFKNQLQMNETITGSPAWSVSVKTGTDTTPGDMLVSGPIVSGTKVSQKFTGGVDGVEYYIVGRCTTSDTETIEQLCTLLVTDEEG